MAHTKPTATVRIGSIKAAIWTNDTPGGPRHSVTFERLYKDGASWKSTRSFSRDDLLVLAKVADLAYSRILELEDPPDRRVSPVLTAGKEAKEKPSIRLIEDAHVRASPLTFVAL